MSGMLSWARSSCQPAEPAAGAWFCAGTPLLPIAKAPSTAADTQMNLSTSDGSSLLTEVRGSKRVFWGWLPVGRHTLRAVLGYGSTLWTRWISPYSRGQRDEWETHCWWPLGPGAHFLGKYAINLLARHIAIVERQPYLCRNTIKIQAGKALKDRRALVLACFPPPTSATYLVSYCYCICK